MPTYHFSYKKGHVSMSEKHKYVTQSSIWDNPSTGPLTDARIRHYERERARRMGKTLTNASKTKKNKTTKPAKQKKPTAKELLALLLAD